eukprot:UN03864
MWRLSQSLQQFDAMFIIPLNQCMWIFFSVISGGIYFKEFSHMTFLQISTMVYIMFLILFGVFYLVPDRAT